MIPVEIRMDESAPAQREASLRQLAVDIQLGRVVCSDDFFGPQETRDFRRLRPIFLGLMAMDDNEILNFQKRCPFIYQYKRNATHIWEGKQGERQYYFSDFLALPKEDAEKLYKLINSLDPKSSFFDIDVDRMRRELWGNSCTCTFTEKDDLLLSHFAECPKYNKEGELKGLLSNLAFAFDEYVTSGTLTLETKKLLSKVFVVFGFMEKAKYHV